MCIFQYIPSWAAIKVIRSSSAFKLSSLRYYRELEKENNENEVGIGDASEARHTFKNIHTRFGNPVLISSWSIPE